jgi:hypothetical protein
MVTVQEYLTTRYEADREYVDGQLLERHSGEQPLNEKLLDYYFQMGVRYVWVVDSLAKRAFCLTSGEMHEVLDSVLRASDPDVAVQLAGAFEE